MILDPDENHGRGAAQALADLFETLHFVSSLAQAVKHLNETSYSLILAEAHFPTADGITQLRRIRVLAPDTPLVIWSAYIAELSGPLVTLGANRILEKPVDLKHLRKVVESLLDPLNKS